MILSCVFPLFYLTSLSTVDDLVTQTLADRMITILTPMISVAQAAPPQKKEGEGGSSVPPASSTQDRDDEDEVKELAQHSRSRLLDNNRANINELWSEWHQILRQLTKRQFNQDHLPEPSWLNVFSEDKSSNLKKIQSMTQQILGHLKNSKAQQLKTNYFDLKTQIEEEHEEALRLADDRYVAPEEGEHQFWEKHKGHYTELIQRKQEAIEALKKEQNQIIQDSHDFLLSIGIELSTAQVEHLFKMSSGDLMLDLFVTFAHLNLLGELVTDRMRASQNDLAYVKNSEQYYSIYVALVTLSLDIHKETHRQIIEEHIPKVNMLIQSLHKITKETHMILKDEKKKLRRQAIPLNKTLIDQLQKNLKVQKVALEGAKAYQVHLAAQANEIKRGSELIARRLRVAVNTYKTVRLSTNQLDLIEEGLRDLSNLRRIQLPAMIPLANERVQSQLDVIVKHMNGEQSIIQKWKTK